MQAPPGASLWEINACQNADSLFGEQGFVVLTEVDVTKMLKSKIDKVFRPYVILGACNPNLAFKAPSAGLGIELMLH